MQRSDRMPEWLDIFSHFVENDFPPTDISQLIMALHDTSNDGDNVNGNEMEHKQKL